MNPTSQPEKKHINPARLIAFSDGIFAIAVTLLAFNLKVPVIKPGNVHLLLSRQLVAMTPYFLTYIITFLLVAVYWTIHHRLLDIITHIDGNFIWINIAYLLFISFLPFPSALIGTYPKEQLSIILYLSCVIMVGCLTMCMLWYASHNCRLIEPDLPKAIIRYYFTRALTSLSIILIILILAIVQVPGTQYFLFILIPINFTIKTFYKNHRHTRI